MKLLFVPFAFLFLGLLPHACADEPPIKAAINSFIEAMKRGDAERAISFVYQRLGTEQRTQARVRSLTQKAKSTEGSPEYVDASAQATIAIAVVKDTAKRPDGKADFDAVLLLNRDGKWLVVMGIAEVEDRTDVLTGEERKQLAQLRQWQDIRMRELSSTPPQPK